MSLSLNFEPHSWYMGFAIRMDELSSPESSWKWLGVIDNGNTYQIDELTADTFEDLKAQIREYHLCKHNGYGERIARRRLEQLRTALRSENISYSELAELWKFHEYIEDGDVELLEAAGVPEGSR